MWLFWTLFCILFTFLVALESFGGPSSLPRQHTAIGVSKGLIGEEVSKTAGILLASVLRARSPVMLDYHAEDHGARQVLIAAVHVERQEGGPEDGSFSRRLLQSPVTPQESLAAAPPPPAPPPRVKVCYDTPYNFSADGRTCDKYIDDDEAQDDLRLPLRGCRFSKAAGEACCRCGGGVSLCEEERNWYDSQGIACQSYDKARCSQAAAYARDGRTAFDVCCLCGGGMRPCADDPFGSLCPEVYYWLPSFLAVLGLLLIASVLLMRKFHFCCWARSVLLTDAERLYPKPKIAFFFSL